MYNLVDIHFHTDDSFDAFKGEPFNVQEILDAMKGEDEESSVRLVCKTDHNRLNFRKYYSLHNSFAEAGIKLLPGIEINTQDNIHWLFIFDDQVLNLGIPEDDDFRGDTLEQLINNYFGYTSDDETSLLRQAEEAQTRAHDLKEFIKKLNEGNFSFIAIPHLNKTRGWYEKLKKDPKQVEIIEEFLNSNIINGFECKNQEEFIAQNIALTERHIAELQNQFDKFDEEDPEKRQLQSEIDKRMKHLKEMLQLENSIQTGDVSLIYGSDFHCKKGETIKDYAKLKEKLFYMKAECSFEGLRISLLDQYSRIFSVDKMQKFNKENIKCIDKIELEIGKTKTSIKLGDGLNSIIGARGSGKSYFLNLLLGNVAKYGNAAIKNDIQLTKIVFQGGEEKSELTAIDCDILSQRGTESEKENSIYSLLADAPFRMESYLEQLKGLGTKTKSVLQIESNINALNSLVEHFLTLKAFRDQDLDCSFFEAYNSFFESQSDNMKIHELFSATQELLDNEKNRLGKAIEKIRFAQKLGNDLILSLDEISEIKETRDIGISFDEEKQLLDKLSKEKLIPITEKILRNKYCIEKSAEIVNNVLKGLKDGLTNTETVFTLNMNAIKDFFNKAVSELRETKKLTTRLSQLTVEENSDEEFYEISVGINSLYRIKTIAKIDLFDLNENAFHELFKNYKLKYDKGVLLNCLKHEDYGRYFCSNVYTTIDKRHRTHELGLISPQQELYLDFAQGDYKNWSTLSPGERADKLLNIVLNGDSGKILIIDQPEDDLDNETIYRTMVQKIRELKLRRQIIIVTHNANIAISGDSDRLIVCQNNNGAFSCYCDGIESTRQYDYHSINSTIRNQKILTIAAKILDGGKEALRKRVRKIGYKDLFYKEEQEIDDEEDYI